MSHLKNAPSLTVSQRIKASGLIPIVRFHHIGQADKIAEALHAAGVDCFEFSMTSSHALKAIEKVADIFGDSIIVGAGTVLDGETARREFGKQRLHVAQDGGAGCGIADMADRDGAGQALDHLAAGEGVPDQADVRDVCAVGGSERELP